MSNSFERRSSDEKISWLADYSEKIILSRDLSPKRNKKGEKYDSPRPPDAPRRSLVSKYSKPITFNHHQTTHPILLQEVNNMVSEGLNKLSKVANAGENDQSDGIEKVDIYSKAFQRYINDCNIYQPFLLSVKQEYDKIVNLYSGQIHMINSLQSQLATKEHEFLFRLKEVEQAHSIAMADADQHKKMLEKIIADKERDLNATNLQVAHYKKIAEKAEKELLEARGSCVTLTSSLTRLEEERRSGVQREQASDYEILALKTSAEKMTEEVEK